MSEFRRYPYELKDLKESDWTYIHKYRCSFAYPEEYKLEQGLKFPGFILDRGNYFNKYKEFINFIQKNFEYSKLVSPRGNLSSKYWYIDKPAIICGIAPGYSNLSRNEPKWLLGPSSKILHKILYVLETYPYFTNIYKNSFIHNNTDAAKDEELDSSLRLLGEELDIIYNIYKNNIVIITLGSYREYSGVLKYCKNRNYFKVVNTYHPSYYLRNGVTSVNDPLVRKGIEKIYDQLGL